MIRKNEVEHLFPLFMSTYAVAFENAKPQAILDVFRTTRPRSIQRSEDCVKLKVPTLVQDARHRIAAMMGVPAGALQGATEGQQGEGSDCKSEHTCPVPSFKDDKK